jgi:hypothetical protein
MQEGKNDKNVKTFKTIRPFFRGLTLSVLSSMPKTGTSLMTYDLMKNIYFGAQPKKDPDILSIMAIGSASAIITDSIFYPIKVLQSRLIVSAENHSMFSLSKEMYKTKGISSFFKGYSIQIVKTIPSHAVSFGVYELCKKWFGISGKKVH